MTSRLFSLGILVGFLASPVSAQFDSGSDGSDGAFNPGSNVVIDLSLAATATWDTPSPVAGRGVYDPDKWAVVFKYATINVPSGVTVTFTHHPSGAPLVWLTTGSATIAGTVSLNGHNGSPAYSVPGPGGFGGAAITAQAAGFGPGGGNGLAFRGSGSYGTLGSGTPSAPAYGMPQILPLIGGSGGATGFGATGGAGGGAILIASSATITLTGSLRCDGGIVGGNDNAGCGSGGAIRLIAATIQGSVDTTRLTASGGQFGNSFGGSGRIRIEAETNLLNGSSLPAYTFSTPGPVFPPSGSPTLRATLVDGAVVPADPIAGILTGDVDIDNGDAVTVNIEATNISVGTTVNVFAVPTSGNVVTATSTPLANAGGGLLTATASITLPPGRSEMYLKANWTP